MAAAAEEERGAAAATEAADPCVALRLVAAAAWHVVQKRQADNLPRVLVLLEAVADAAPNLVHFRHFVKLRLGLQAKIVMEMLQNKQPHWKIYEAMDTYFPEKEPEPHPKATARDLKLVQTAQENFRVLVLGLLSDPDQLEKYVQEHLEHDYGEDFMRVVEELFHDYLWQLESALPEPCLQELLEAARIQGPSRPPQPDSVILSQYLTVMGYQGAEPPAPPATLRCPSPQDHEEEEEEGLRNPELQSSPLRTRRARRQPPCFREENSRRPQTDSQETDVVLDSSSEGDSSPFREVRRGPRMSSRQRRGWSVRRVNTSAPGTAPSSPHSRSTSAASGVSE
ncbi:TERF1-interacting nuclear factor 2 isoform X2 [Varanus komodoensis]|uniref:TERF1-interacting nuclear factor 2 isoform X2 n=1 Tax=Varanus komodoensis TaxID=61221 RepID=UPI001CF7D461|nr:TERF1-interacting nuclear factor 2 isoform X2 [Varanus komodoensis]